MCGILGVIGTHDLSRAVDALCVLHKRGQDSAGLSWLHKNSYNNDKTLGKASFLKRSSGAFDVCVGATRYPTSGCDISKTSLNEFTQPYTITTRKGQVSVVHNGNLIFPDKGSRVSDSQLFAEIIAKNVDACDTISEAIKKTMTEIDGSYSVTAMVNNTLIAFRDPQGIRPLFYGRNKTGYVVISESHALQKFGAVRIGDVKPGSLLVFSPHNCEEYQLVEPQPAHCMFEYTYFAQSPAVIDQLNVDVVRVKLGQQLAAEVSANIISQIDYIIPVPNTSKPAAQGFSEKTGVPYRDAIIKEGTNGDERTFITNEKKRSEMVKHTYLINDTYVNGKIIFLIDDSIVRGNTLGSIVSLLKSHGAREVHVGVTTPPIVSPCFYGIDMTRRRELIAANKSIAELEKQFGCESLTYISIEGLKQSIGHPDQLCLGCLTGTYPTKKGNALMQAIINGEVNDGKRPYEGLARG